ncbi:MAG: hypothetical protein Q8932_09890 [Bacteroidota bacterium]|nr:hypothetical protein [Bacteroidota bacterium]MDP4246148.1 hypothetical protein [Bacteroidota bacterium]MDP4255968.1 hypothetical protein [Bacteroidota bacterium]MDP4259551.1 hypothetical protein [Bacteroidota bacterium]
MVIIVFGLPGSGKSSFASGLARRLHCLYSESGIARRGIDTQEAIRRKMDIVLCGAGEGVAAGWIREAGGARGAGGEIVFIEIRADAGLRAGEASKQPGEATSKQAKEAMDDPHLVLYSSGTNTEILIDIAYDHLHLKHGRRLG